MDCFVKDTCKKYKENNCENGFCQKLFRLNYLYDNALISKTQRANIKLMPDADGRDDYAFDRLANAKENIDIFVESGANLFIYSSNTGNGKTSWALKLIQAFFNEIWWKTDFKCRALFINVPRFLLELKENISNKSDYISHIKQNVLTADLVVWDDIATKNATEFEAENLLSMINARIDSGKSNIYTANIGREDLEGVLGARLSSRILGMSKVIEFKGVDKRGIQI